MVAGDGDAAAAPQVLSRTELALASRAAEAGRAVVFVGAKADLLLPGNGNSSSSSSSSSVEKSPAVAAAARALALDPEPPLLHYLHAQSLAGLGRNAEAEAEYAESRERTVGNLGSRRSVNAVVRRVAQDVGAAFVDAEAIFEADEHARGGWFNATLFVDDCHPNAYGHYLIARALGPVIEEALRGLPR